ncbi:hypothetical protein Poli38472_004450 [Pythium oligandrum]|uniref:Alpha/beta hydrolase fold-3 domain-containing protein n=1 Tax=Pythium oligandrum TaxID=41045 RepID=A0A8K1CAG7_PYTOL|nr:hypothetical protein Poli38472_004450 [Pythium oligandrum]|eukprot:TMW59381.1 hypothetical protein Poli38472_004450 [Pythium oligandrum]
MRCDCYVVRRSFPTHALPAMVSVVTKSSSRHPIPLDKALRLLRSRVIALLLNLNGAKLRGMVLRGGSVYAFFALMLGGFYDKPWELVEVASRMSFTIVRAIAAYVARGCKPLYPGWTLPFEVTRAVIRCSMSVYGDRLLVPSNAQFVRTQSEWVGTALGFLSSWQMGTKTEAFHHNGLEHMWVRNAKRSVTPNTRRFVVLYYHGGGFAVLSPRMYIHFANEMQTRIAKMLHEQLGDHEDDTSIQVEILLANYRKLPEYQYPVPPEDAYKMYEYLLHVEKVSPNQIVLAGDSAGGSLAMSTLIRIRDQQPTQPLGAFLSCPFVDLEVGGDERRVPHCLIGDKASDAIYTAYHPRNGPPSTWGDASPVHCDLQGLPPVYIQAAELDYILPHAQNLYAKAKADGLTDWTLDVHKEVPHVFTTFPTSIIRAADKGLDDMARFAATQFADSIRRPQCA